MRSFLKAAFNYINVDIVFKGIGANEVGIDKKTKKIIVKSIPYYYRPNEVNNLIGDASKAKRILNWKPKINFKQLVASMLEKDLQKS